MGRERSSSRIAVLALLLCVTTAACGVDAGDDQVTAGSAVSPTAYLADVTRGRAGLDVLYRPTDVRDFVEARDDALGSLAELVVTGRVVSYEEGAAFVDTGPDGATSMEVVRTLPEAAATS